MAWKHSLAQNVTVNAAANWLLIAVALLTGLTSLVVDSLLGGVLALAAVAVLAAPAVVQLDWRVMLPWPLALAVAVGLVARSLRYAPEVTGYVVISAVSLAVVVELDAFTGVKMSRRFAVLFALMTTIAFQTWWSIAQYYSDQLLGTTFIRTQTELQWDLFAVTAVSLVMSALFLWYFDHIEHVGTRRRPVIPEEAS
jgi:hypothetical protein